MLPVSLQLSGGHAVRLCQDWQHGHLLHQHALQTSAFTHLAAEHALVGLGGACRCPSEALLPLTAVV